MINIVNIAKKNLNNEATFKKIIIIYELFEIT